jgi:hypothetical protein
MNEMNDRELQDLLQKWTPPEMPRTLKMNLVETYRKRQKRNWRWLFAGSLQVPIPIAALAILAMSGLAIAVLMSKFQSPLKPLLPQVVNHVVEIPVVRDRVIARTIYREPPAPRKKAIPASYQGINLREFKPVASLSPRIIRRSQNVDQD